MNELLFTHDVVFKSTLLVVKPVSPNKPIALTAAENVGCGNVDVSSVSKSWRLQLRNQEAALAFPPPTPVQFLELDFCAFRKTLVGGETAMEKHPCLGFRFTFTLHSFEI